MNASTTLKKFGLEQVFHYIYKDPEINLPEMILFPREKQSGK